MALKIRLRQQGRNNRQTYRLVVTDIRNPRDGKYLEMVGWYNPFESDTAKEMAVDGDRINYWLGQGAELSDKAEQLISKVAPDVITALRAKQRAKQLKEIAVRKKSKAKKVKA
jgi:small subunit ribosomal protein S16